MQDISPPSGYQIGRMVENMQEIQHVNEIKYITDAVVDVVSNEGFWLVCIFLAYRLVRYGLQLLSDNGWLK